MKLARFAVEGKKSIGVLRGEYIIDIAACCRELREEFGSCAGLVKDPEMVDFLRLGEKGVAIAEKVESLFGEGSDDLERYEFVYGLKSVKLLAPVPRPGKIICLGLNYSDHTEEQGITEPTQPILFSKPTTAIIGHEEPIIYPKISKKIDYEVELAMVIGKSGKDIPKQKAFDHIAGYTVFNDVSARDIQFGDGQWFRGKSFDTFAPTGPCIAFRDQIPDPNRLRLGTRVNGEVRQDGTTAHMIFDVPYIVAFISQVMTLEPGDIIATGTPAGVGIFIRPEPKLLKPGDIVEAWVENIGTLRNWVKQTPEE